MCCVYVEGEIGAVEGEYSGAVKGTWGDVIFIVCYWVCCDEDRGGSLGSDFVGDNGWCVVGCRVRLSEDSGVGWVGGM